MRVPQNTSDVQLFEIRYAIDFQIMWFGMITVKMRACFGDCITQFGLLSVEPAGQQAMQIGEWDKNVMSFLGAQLRRLV